MLMCDDKDELTPLQKQHLKRLFHDVADEGRSSNPSVSHNLPTREVSADVDVEDTALDPVEPVKEQGGRLSGRMIGPYRVKRLIGGGGMGQVYEALQDRPRRTVALKVMRASIDSESARRRFEFEAQILARLQHSNIAQIFGAGMWVDEGRDLPYFVMEYVAGKPIDSYVSERDLSLHDKIEIFVQVCNAVSHGHERGIIHRDLKPANVLVSTSGEVKVIDFGVARASDSDMRMTQDQTSVGQIFGTIQYMSPEQCAADPNDLDIRTDVYALGVMLYQLLVSRMPYDIGRTAIHEAIRIVQETQPTSITAVDATIPRDIDIILSKALEKDPARRYRSAGELGDDLQRFLGDEAIVARPPSFSEHVRRFARKHRATTSAVVAVSIAFILAVVAVLFFGIEASRQRADAADKARIAEEQRLIAVEAQAATAVALDSERKARSEAERNARLVSDAALNFFGPVPFLIKDLPDSMEGRETLIRTGYELLQGLQASIGENADPELLARMALAHESLGDLLGGRRTANLGRIDEAISEYAQAEKIWRSLRANEVEGVEADAQLAMVINKQVDLTFANDPDLAFERLAESRRISLALLDRDPENIRYLRTYMVTVERLADSLLPEGRLAEAMVLCREYHDIAAMLCELMPERSQYCRDLGMALRRIGWIQAEQGQQAEAERAFRSSLQIMSRIQEQEVDNIRFGTDVAWACWFLGELLIENGDLDEGAGELQRCVELMTRSCALDPNVADYRLYVLQVMSEAWRQLNELALDEIAESMRDEVLILLQPVSEQNPENMALRQLIKDVRGLSAGG